MPDEQKHTSLPDDLRETHLGRAAREFQTIRWLWNNHRVMAALAVLAVLGGFLYLLHSNRRLSLENVELRQRMAPFEAIAAKSFPNQEDRMRLDLLIQTIEEFSKKYGSFELRRADALEFAQQTRQFAGEYQKTQNKKPTVQLVLDAVATDASRTLFHQFRTSLLDAGWDVKVHSDLLQVPTERGIWLYTKNLKEPSKQQQFWIHLFVKFGLNLKSAYWANDLGDDEVVLVINDPSYIR